MQPRKAPLLLCIMDGVGLAPPGPDNAWSEANTPTLDNLFANNPHSELRTDGEHVGLPEGQMGNSEVGHMAIGSGQIVRQALAQISHDLREGLFSDIPGFSAFQKSAKDARAIHLIGLVSDGGVHSHIAVSYTHLTLPTTPYV